MVRPRRFAQIWSDGDEDDVPAIHNSMIPDEMKGKRKTRKKVRYYKDEVEDTETEADVVEEKQGDAKPVGEPGKVTGKGKGKRIHFDKFEHDENTYELEDTVLLYTGDERQKPYIAIIKDITQINNGSMMILGQWFYRPEEAMKKDGGKWETSDTREIFYSFHRDEVPAESVMHRCLVYFIPPHKQLPKPKENPGFFVRKVYDIVEKNMWNLTNEDYEATKQREIDLLIEKTISRLGDLPDIEPEEMHVERNQMIDAKCSRCSQTYTPSHGVPYQLKCVSCGHFPYASSDEVSTYQQS